ncbi:MAG: hypothetical protein V1918_00165 [Planctomycetota bacterium]
MPVKPAHPAWNRPFTRPGRRGERGSVLVVCIGVLAILVIMATAFLSSMSLHRSMAGNMKRRVHAELAAKQGLAQALARIAEHYETDSYTALNQDWFTEFNASPAGSLPATVEMTVLPDVYGLDNTHQLYPDDAVHFYRGRIFGPNDTGDENLQFRYAIVTLDLSGLLYCNPDADPATWEENLFSALALARTSAGTGEYADLQTFFNDNFAVAPQRSILQLASHDPNQRFALTRMIPFGSTARAMRGTGHSDVLNALNLNTMPRALRNACLLYTCDLFALQGSSSPDFGIPGMDALEDDDGANIDGGATLIGPLDDSAVFTDLFGQTWPDSSYAPINGEYYQADILQALKLAMQEYCIGGGSYPCQSIQSFENYFLTQSNTLNAYYDILNVYNQDLGTTPSSDEWSFYTYTPPASPTWYHWGGSVPDTACIARSARMETAVNDLLNSLFNDDTTAYTSSSTPGFYDIDLDASGTDWGLGYLDSLPPSAISQHYNSTCEVDNGVTTAGDREWGRLPELYVGKSNWFYIAVRGECAIAGNWGDIPATRGVEAVIYVYDDFGTTRTRVVYQRWFND